MNSLAGVVKGDHLIVHAIGGAVRQYVVTSAGPVWVTAGGERYRRENGHSLGGGTEPWAETVAQHEEHTERERLVKLLRPWGFSPANGTRTLTLDQLRRLVSLVDRMERTEELSEEGQYGSAFIRMGCWLVDGEPLMEARQRGSAAECAEDAAELLRRGKAAEARNLLASAAYYVTRQEGRLS